MSESLQVTLYGVFLVSVAIVVILLRGIIFRTGDRFANAIYGEDNKARYVERKKRSYHLFIGAILTLGTAFIVGGLLS